MNMLQYLGLVLGACTSLAFVAIHLHWRFLYAKPSIQVLLGSHFLLQWPLIVRWPLVNDFLPFPAEAFLLIHGFIIIGLLVSFRTFRGPARLIFARVAAARLLDDSRGFVQFMLIASTIFVCFAAYLRSVEISQLGLVVGFTNPEASLEAREESYKLIDSSLAKYAYSLIIEALGPIASVFASVYALKALRSGHVLRASFYILFFLCLMVVVSVTGARYFAAALILNVLVAWAFRKSLSIKPGRILIGAAAALIPPMLLTSLREGSLDQLGAQVGYLTDALTYRIFVGPSDVVMWYMHYAQTFEEFGIRGIPRLAELFGYGGVNSPNLIGLHYHKTDILSVNANGGYLFSYYLYFGLLSLPISLVLLWILDGFLLIVVRLKGLMLLAVVTAMAVASLSFQQSDYTVCLLTHGFAVIPIVGLLIEKLRPRSTQVEQVDRNGYLQGRTQ